MMLASGVDAAFLRGGFCLGCLFLQFLLMMLASGFDPGSAGFSAGDVPFCQFLLMMLASVFYVDSARVFCRRCLFLRVFANDAGF